MNPFDAIGTARISSAVYDRVCRLVGRLPIGPRRRGHRHHAARPHAGSCWLAECQSRSGSPAHIPTFASVRRCAVRSTSRPSQRRSRRCGTRRRPLRRRSRQRDRRPVRAASIARRVVAQRRIDRRPSCGTEVFAEREQDASGKATAPDGATAKPSDPGRRGGRRSDRRVSAPHDVSPRARRQPTLPTGLARGGPARRGRDRGRSASTIPTRRLLCSPISRVPLTGDSASSPAGWRRGCSSTSPVVDPRRRRGVGRITRAALPARWRRPRFRRQLRRDRRGRRRWSGDRCRAAADPFVEHTRHRVVPRRRPQRIDGRQAAGHARRSLLRRSPCAVPTSYSVIAFGKDVVAVKSQDDDKPGERVVTDVLSLRGHGTTDLAGALRRRWPAAEPEQRRAQDRDPAERLPGDGRRRRALQPQRCRSW